MKYAQLILILIVLTACQNGEPLVTPPIVPANTPTTAVTAPPQTLTPPPATNTPATAPELPTAVPTATPPPPSPTPVPAPAQPVNQIQLVPIATEGLNLPVYLTHAGDGRLFVVQQNGIIRIIQDGVVIEEPFLNIRERVGAEGNEQGLLSVAFHPDYAQNGTFYVNYTDLEFNTTIARFQVSAADPNLADPASEQILLTIPQPHANHNGGLVKFGPDGYLYIGMGDGGSQGDPDSNGQDTRTLLGDILRIDVNNTGDAPYGIPATNPFAGDERSRNEIWASGFRNPWRFSFDRATGDLYIADVGQNEWEEVNFQPASSPGGGNYGWKIMEATHCYERESCDTEGLVQPIFEYNHSEGCSVTGGYVYRGAQFPELSGNYFMADYCTGRVWRLFLQPDGSWDTAVVLESGLKISSFGEDAQGELYAVDHDGGVYQIRP